MPRQGSLEHAPEAARAQRRWELIEAPRRDVHVGLERHGAEGFHGIGVGEERRVRNRARRAVQGDERSALVAHLGLQGGIPAVGVDRHVHRGVHAEQAQPRLAVLGPHELEAARVHRDIDPGGDVVDVVALDP